LIQEVSFTLLSAPWVENKNLQSPENLKAMTSLYYGNVGAHCCEFLRLSNIAGTLKEDQSLIKTEDRLSRNLDDEDFTDQINE
jgi:hypothetical protein